jgi:hypothetical protein
LPRDSIKRAQISDKIVFEKYPAFAGFGAANYTRAGFFSHHRRRHMQKHRCGF